MNDKEDIKGEGPDNANSVDAALQFIRNGDVISMTPEQEKKLVWKIDLMLIPLMCLYCLAANRHTRANWSHAVACYFLQYLDKILRKHLKVPRTAVVINIKYSQLRKCNGVPERHKDYWRPVL